MTLTERIKKLADLNSMTFASLEREAQIGRGTIRKWDTNCPSADKLQRIAEILNCSIDYLVSGKYATSSVNTEESISISTSDTEWLDLIHKLPLEKQLELKGYVKRMIEESSVAADEPIKKTGTDKPGK